MIQSLNPRSGEPFGPRFAEAESAAVIQAVGRALASFLAVRDASPETLSAALDGVASALDAQAEELVEVAALETALGLARLEVELQRTTDQLRMFAQLVSGGRYRAADISFPRVGPARELRRVQVPLGVVAVFAASNFPFAFSVAGGDTASALAAGCAVVVKAHYGHPQTSARVAEIARTALAANGLPEEALQLLHGGAATGRHLVLHPDLAAVGFTGSTSGGRAIFDLAASRPDPIPVYAEQGSVNPVVIAPSAVADDRSLLREAELLAGSVLNGGGQFCTKPGLLFAPRIRAADFGSAFVQHIASAPPIYLLTSKIRDEFRSGIDTARQVDGVRSWAGEAPPSGYGVAPTLLTVASAQFRADPRLRGELFGPATVIVEVDDLDDLRASLAVLEGNLTGTVHGVEDDPWVIEAARVLAAKVGRLIFGGVPTGVAVDVAMQHGGPYPASSSARDTSVGAHAVERFMRPIAYQDFPAALLPAGARSALG